MLSRTVCFGHTVTVHQRRACRWVHVEAKLEALGIQLPPAPTPKANYNIVCHASSNMLYVSGHLPMKADGTLMTGRIGPDSDGGKSIAYGYEAARHVGLNIISTLKQQLGDLDRVEQVVKVRFLLERCAVSSMGALK
jgi:enamine deaminase RidA (YjgF/YER057c/UK114 family)